MYQLSNSVIAQNHQFSYSVVNFYVLSLRHSDGLSSIIRMKPYFCSVIDL